MSDPLPDPKQRPPSLAELFELSLSALANAPRAFAGLAARPSARKDSILILAMAWGGAFFALNLAYFAPLNPAVFAALSSWQIATTCALGLCLWAAIYLLAASFLYGLGRALGSEGDFDRALLLCAFVAAAAPVSGLCNWFESAWFAPALLAGWIAACGLTALFQANAWAARAACAALAAGFLAVQYGAREFIARSAPIAQSAAQLSGDLQTLQLKMEQLQPEAGRDEPASRSGLDLLSAPDEASAPSAPDQRELLRAAAAEGDELNRSAVAMLDALAPMLNNPAISRNLNPRQKADFAELRKMIADLKGGIASKTRLSPEQRQKNMLKIQKLTMSMMGAGLAPPQAAGAQK